MEPKDLPKLNKMRVNPRYSIDTSNIFKSLSGASNTSSRRMLVPETNVEE